MPTNQVGPNQFAIHEKAPGGGPQTLMLDGSPSVASITFTDHNPVVTMTITVNFNPAHFEGADLTQDSQFFHNIINFGQATILSAQVQASTESSGENTVFRLSTQTIAIESQKDKFGRQ